MAASALLTLLRRFPNPAPFLSACGVQVPLQTLCTKVPPEEDSLPSIPISPYENEPWKYLDSEEYQSRYGSRPVWADYRRNHKGGIPPQRTRKTCIRNNKVAGNPCPICRDHKLHVDFRNVKLLEQFVCAHTGIIFHAPYTGVCMKQHKKLTQAIQKARECAQNSGYRGRRIAASSSLAWSTQQVPSHRSCTMRPLTLAVSVLLSLVTVPLLFALFLLLVYSAGNAVRLTERSLHKLTLGYLAPLYCLVKVPPH